MQLQRTIHAVIRPGEQSGYVAECPALHAVTQGRTLDEIARWSTMTSAERIAVNLRVGFESHERQ